MKHYRSQRRAVCTKTSALPAAPPAPPPGSGHRLFLIQRRALRPVGAEGGAAEEFAVLGATGNGGSLGEAAALHSPCAPLRALFEPPTVSATSPPATLLLSLLGSVHGHHRQAAQVHLPRLHQGQPVQAHPVCEPAGAAPARDRAAGVAARAADERGESRLLPPLLAAVFPPRAGWPPYICKSSEQVPPAMLQA